MKILRTFETYTSKVTIGIDIDGTICNFSDAYNTTYEKYFPGKKAEINDDWYWYRRMDYNGEDPDKWFKAKKAEFFEIANPYPNAVNTINNIYEFIKTYGFTLKIVTFQPTEESKDAAKKWIDKYGFKYDDIIFTTMAKEKWNYVDIMVDDAEKVVKSKPLSKICIKIEQLWNTNCEGDFNIPNIKGLTIDLVKQAVGKLKNTNVS